MAAGVIEKTYMGLIRDVKFIRTGFGFVVEAKCMVDGDGNKLWPHRPIRTQPVTGYIEQNPGGKLVCMDQFYSVHNVIGEPPKEIR